MPPTALTWLAVAALGLAGWSSWRKHHRRRLADQSLTKTRALQTWEGEGGGLPDGGPHVTPVGGAPEVAAGDATDDANGTPLSRRG